VLHLACFRVSHLHLERSDVSLSLVSRRKRYVDFLMADAKRVAVDVAVSQADHRGNV
jgi:hypothetical protein